jgi:hypothetical protein
VVLRFVFRRVSHELRVRVYSNVCQEQKLICYAGPQLIKIQQKVMWEVWRPDETPNGVPSAAVLINAGRWASIQWSL